jgi:Xaa-Pro aminopeptidase
MGRVTREKLAQAASLAAELGIDVWMTFVRETAGAGDPALPLILEGGLTWQSALLVGANGRKVAVVGNYDADPLLASGDWDEVIPYVESVRLALLGALAGFRPSDGRTRIAVNYSLSDDKADGLTHGMFLLLQDVLAGTEFEGGVESAEPLLTRLRGQKTPEELRRIRSAIKEGDLIFAEVPAIARLGMSERALYDQIQRRMDERGLGYAWDRAGDPIVNFGPDSMIGHGIPSAEIGLAVGQVLHIDLGVIKDGYASDVQRCWYVGEPVPDEVRRALDAVNAAIDAGAALLRPGSIGHEVDAAARRTIVERGYPEYRHALGHQVGRMAHDGGALLGPAWDRYGQSPFMPARVGEVYTLELGVTVAERGYVGVEEMVEVTADGCRFLTERQLTMPTLPVRT